MKPASLFGLLLLPFAVCLAQSAAPGPASGAIGGVVRDAITGQPVAEAGVNLRLAGGRVISSRVDAQGHYTLDPVPPGVYRLEASAPLEEGQTLTPQQEKTVTVEAGQKLIADFRLPSMGTITGRVLDQNGKPIPDEPVFLVEKRYDHGALQYRLAGGRTQTDEAGAYRLTGIPSGEEFLVQTRNRVPQKSTEHETPADTFYPNAISPETATGLVLGPGETRYGIDIHRAKLPAYCVDGIVAGAPDSALAVEFSDAVVMNSSHAAQQMPAGKTKLDGTFHFCGLHRGQYVFTAKDNFPASMPFLATGTLEVASGDVRDFRMQPAVMSPVLVEFAWDGEPPAQTASLNSGVFTLQGRNEQFGFGFGVRGNASRSITVQPDDYTIEVRGMTGGLYVKDATCGGKSVLHGIAPLGGAASCGSLRFILAHDGASLTIRVADKDGNPVADAYVAVIPESAATEGEMAAAMTFGETGPDGVFQAANLAPGKYRALATNETIDLAANRVDMLWIAQARAQEVELGPNGNTQLKLEPQTLR